MSFLLFLTAIPLGMLLLIPLRHPKNFCRSLWGIVDVLLKSPPADPAPWRRVCVMIALVSLAIWVLGLVALSFVRHSQYGGDALEADRQRFCGAVAYAFDLPYRLLEMGVHWASGLSTFYIILAATCGVGCLIFFLIPLVWICHPLRWLLFAPPFVAGAMLSEPPRSDRYDAATPAGAVPFLLLFLALIGWNTLPLAALWYLFGMAVMTVFTLSVFAEDKLISLANQVLRQQQEQGDKSQGERWRGGANRLPARFHRQRRFGNYRIPEAYLLAVSLLGGWPGAVTGQRLLSHKISLHKPDTVWFVAMLYAAIAVHNAVAITALFLWA